MLAGDGQGWQQCERVGRDQLGTGRGCEQEVAEMPSDSSSARSWSGITNSTGRRFRKGGVTKQTQQCAQVDTGHLGTGSV